MTGMGRLVLVVDTVSSRAGHLVMAAVAGGVIDGTGAGINTVRTPRHEGTPADARLPASQDP